MFQRRMKVIGTVDQLRQLAASLNGLKVPIYAVEEALYFMKDGKKRLDYFKLDYILKLKTLNSPHYDEYKNIAKDDNHGKEKEEVNITYKGIFENIGFCIEKYFQSHYYLGHKAVCQMGNIADVELYYHPKQDVKFTVVKIRVLKTLDISLFHKRKDKF